MVLVEPPKGWGDGCLQGDSASPGPPPLDRVTESLTLELEPVEFSLLDAILSRPWLLWGGAAVTVLIVVSGLWWLLMPESPPRAVAIGGERPATTVAVPVVDPSPSVPESQPSDTDDEETTKQPPGPSSVNSDEAAASVKERLTTPTAPTSEPTDVPSMKPTEPDPFPPIDDAVEVAKQAEVKKSPPVSVDVAARLAGRLPEIELTDIPLVQAVNLLAAIGALPIAMDVDAMARIGVTPRDPISVRLGDTTFGEALQAIVARRGLVVTADAGQVFITVPEESRERIRKVRYTVSDLTGDDEAATAELAALARRLIAPESWQFAGGRGTIEPDGGALVVTQTDDVHQQVLVFCERLRNARHRPLRSRDDPERFTLTTRLDQAREMLDRPVTANFHKPAPLSDILRFLGKASDSTILVDHAALAMAETSDRVEASLTARQQKLGEALADLLRPLGLIYRVVGPRTIQVTTNEAAEEHLELEFYPVGPWLAKGISGPGLAERLKSRIAASTWSDVGGPGEAYFDPPSRCLIVLQSQPAQAAIERLLKAGEKNIHTTP